MSKMPLPNVSSLEELEKLLRKWDDKYGKHPLIFGHFSKALFNLTDFVHITLESYSEYSGGTVSAISKQNKKIEKESKNGRYKGGTVTFGTVLPMIIAHHFIPRLYSLSYLGAWGLFEQYLRDVLWLVITQNIAPARKVRPYVNQARKVDIDK